MSELHLLALYGVIILGVLFANVPLMVKQQGVAYLFSPRDEHRTTGAVAGRIDRAMSNCMFGMALFAPAVLGLVALDLTSNWTLAITWVFVLARFAYIVVYPAGIPVVRSLIWTVTILANVLLYVPVITSQDPAPPSWL